MKSSIIKKDIHDIVGSLQSWDFLKNKTILITGANGFIPAYMVETVALLNEQYNASINVIALVRNEVKARGRFSHLLSLDWFTLLVQDVCEPIRLSCQINYIVHAASQASPKYYGVDPVGTLSANALGTFNVLECARRNIDSIEGVIFFSSAEIYGDVASCSERVPETFMGVLDCLNVRSCYAESKRIGETMCSAWLRQYNIPAKVIRIFHTYGPGMDLNDGRVFADFVRNIVQNENIEIKGTGVAIRAFSYLADTVSAIFTVIALGHNGEAYNIGNEDCEISVYELAKMLIKYSSPPGVDIKKIDTNSGAYLASSINRIVPDTIKVRKLGWQPMFSLEDGFSRTIDYYKR